MADGSRMNETGCMGYTSKVTSSIGSIFAVAQIFLRTKMGGMNSGYPPTGESPTVLFCPLSLTSLQRSWPSMSRYMQPRRPSILDASPPQPTKKLLARVTPSMVGAALRPCFCRINWRVSEHGQWSKCTIQGNKGHRTKLFMLWEVALHKKIRTMHGAMHLTKR